MKVVENSITAAKCVRSVRLQ